jgi:hypothetical protein
MVWYIILYIYIYIIAPGARDGMVDRCCTVLYGVWRGMIANYVYSTIGGVILLYYTKKVEAPIKSKVANYVSRN